MVRILAIYHESDDRGDVRFQQIDVSREPGYWKLAQLLDRPEIEEVRIVGESHDSIAVARTLVVAGKFRRRLPLPHRTLHMYGDESYPPKEPFIFIDPVPDPGAFD